MDRYLHNKELKRFFSRLQLPEDIKVKKAKGICSVADVIRLLEEERKPTSNRKKDVQFYYSDLERYEPFFKENYIQIIELGDYNLAETLFDQNLWKEFADSAGNPIEYIRHLTMSWWSGQVYQQMKGEQ